MKKKFIVVLAVILSLAVLAGCSGNTAGASQAQNGSAASVPNIGKIIVGLDDTFAPMGFRDDNSELVGFDIDLATAVGEELGAEIVFQPIDWGAKEMELEAKKIDCIWNGMSRTPEREASMTLSKDYLNNKIIIMTAADVNITEKSDLVGLKVGTQAESSALEVLKADEIFSDIQDNLSEYSTYDECILDMQAGRIQAMIVDEVLGQYKNNNLEKKFNVAPVDFGDDFYVIGFRKGDTELCSQIEGAIKTLTDSGKATEISKKWFGEDLLLKMD